MVAPKTLDVALDDEAAAIVAEAMGSGAYDAPEQVVNAALRTWKAAEVRISELRAAIEEGASSGPGIPADDVFAELEARYRKMASDAA